LERIIIFRNDITFEEVKRQILLYGIALGLLTILLKFLEYKVLIKDHVMDLYMGAIAVLFTAVGIWAGLKLTRKKEVVVIKEVAVPIDRDNFILNENILQQTGISKREYEVLELIAAGLSNQQIADKLFVSLNTVKTHSSRVFEKLEVSRRTQAVEKANHKQSALSAFYCIRSFQQNTALSTGSVFFILCFTFVKNILCQIPSN